MKPIIFYGIIFVLFANSCFSMANQTMSDSVESKPVMFVSSEEYPTFPGGYKAMLNFIETNMQYPKIDTTTDKRKIVVLQFIVTPSGELTNVKVKRSLSPEFDEEAMRIVKAMPNWLPGKQNGKAVSVQYNLPIHFKVQEQPANNEGLNGLFGDRPYRQKPADGGVDPVYSH